MSIVCNGINAITGKYVSETTIEDLAKLARGEKPNETELKQLEQINRRATEGFLGPKQGVDPLKLDQSGWGVIFAEDIAPATKEALKPLLDHRKAQAKEYYKEFTLPPGVSAEDFLAANGANVAYAVDPEKMPYYVLLVGDPELISYQFQYDLDIQHAVGRICFDSPEEYAQYALSVLEAEKQEPFLPRQATFFGVQNPDDPATKLSANQLVSPLLKELPRQFAQAAGDQPEWSLQTIQPQEATKAKLSQLLDGSSSPALLFTASHGIGFPPGHDENLQLRHQGALLCQDWPGPLQWDWTKQISEQYYFSADDLSHQTNLLGLMAFFFACYGAGTPYENDFYHLGGEEPPHNASRSFVARLPQKLLSLPKGGALAVIGHIDRAWSYSFLWPDSGPQIIEFGNVLTQLLQGHPVGWAMENFNKYHAALSVGLSNLLKRIQFGGKVDDDKLAGIWTANHDARNYVIIGDPAVKLPVSEAMAVDAERPGIPAVEIHSPEPESEPSASAPETVTEDVSEPDIQDFGKISDTLARTKDSLTRILQEYTAKLGETLKESIENVSSLEVATYVSDDMSDVQYNAEIKQFTGNAELRSLTCINLDGDTRACVSEKDEKIDQDLWKMHMEMVQQAQSYRTDLLKTLTSSAAGILGVIKEK